MGTRKTKKKILTRKKGSTDFYPNSKRRSNPNQISEKGLRGNKNPNLWAAKPNWFDDHHLYWKRFRWGERKRNKLATKGNRITKGRQRKEEGKKQNDFTVRKNSSLINTYIHAYLLHKGVENRTPDFSRMPTHSSSPHDFASHRKNRDEIRR